MKRARQTSEALSLDSFLDIVTNVVGVLILVAVVTVLSASDITEAVGATALRAPPRTADTRVLVQCKGGKAYVVDEARHAEAVRDLIDAWQASDVKVDTVYDLIEMSDVGDETYRLVADRHDDGLTWRYQLRARAVGDSANDFRKHRSDLAKALDDVDGDAYVYFVVHEDSFDVFKQARALVVERGLATGWHPVEKDDPLRMGQSGSLGRRVQ